MIKYLINKKPPRFYKLGGMIHSYKGGGKQQISTGGRYKDGTYYKFVSDLYPALYKAWREIGVEDSQARNLATWSTQQAAYESSYGRSNLAANYNYGGIGGPGHWHSFNDIDDYARKYVNILETNFRNCKNAKNLYEFAYGLQGGKKKYCASETVQQYHNHLKGVQTRTQNNLSKYLQTNPSVHQSTQPPTNEEIKQQLDISYDSPYMNADGTFNDLFGPSE